MKKRISLLVISLLLLSVVTLCPSAFTLTRATVHLCDSVSLVKSGIAGEPICFSAADFKQALCVSTLDAVTVTALPDKKEGVLTYRGLRVTEGQTIAAASLGELKFTPADIYVARASFAFTAGSLAGGEELSATLHFHERINYAPTAGEASFTAATPKNTEMRGALSGADPEGDALTYLVVAYPKRGTLCITDSASGDFVYTPRAGYTGKDVFSYVVRDEYGNYSEVATVKITVSKTRADTAE